MRKIALLGACLASALIPAAPVLAASGDISINCAHFNKQPDGNWLGDAEAEIHVAGSRISLANTVLSAKNMQIDGVSMYARLERQCRPQAGKDAVPQRPSPDSAK